MVACIISHPPNKNNVTDDIIDNTTAIIITNLVLQSAFSNLFSNIDILKKYLFSQIYKRYHNIIYSKKTLIFKILIYVYLIDINNLLIGQVF